MPVSATLIREELLPGLMVNCYERYSFAFNDLRGVFGSFETTIAAPHIWVPKLSLPQAIVLGATAAIIKNPVITRRFWSGWLNG